MKNVTIKAIGLAVLFVVGAAVPTQAAVMSPDGHYYEIYQFVPGQANTWDAANAAANASSYLGLPGHLATITSYDEDVLINGLVGQRGEVWAGGYQNPIDQAVATAGWTWVNGEGTFGYSNWLGGEPNDAYGAGAEQYLGLGLGGAFGWNDEGALGNITGYVVEYERSAVPEGTAGLAGILAIVGLFAAHRRVKKT
jgi:hypothetical protein